MEEHCFKKLKATSVSLAEEVFCFFCELRKLLNVVILNILLVKFIVSHRKWHFFR